MHIYTYNFLEGNYLVDTIILVLKQSSLKTTHQNKISLKKMKAWPAFRHVPLGKLTLVLTF